MMIRLINSLYIRMGTDKSVKRYRTYGITTLRKTHVTIGPKGKIVFEFVGKSHIKHKKIFVDIELAAQLKKLAAIARGRKLFQYFDEEERLRPVKPSQVNGYIKSITTHEYSAKDFRTWGASLLAAVELSRIGTTEDQREQQKNIAKVVKKVAEQLGNTPSVCRSSYIHPTILKAYSNGIVLESLTPPRLTHAKLLEAEFEPEEISLLELFKKFRN